MKKRLSLCFVLLMGIQYLYAQAIDRKLQLFAGTGYQQENFHWSIAGSSNGQSPNIYSELKWKHLGGQNIAAAVQWNVWQRFSLYANYNKQYISSGTVNDTDYATDNRGNSTYNETFNGNEGNTRAWQAAVGFIIINNRHFSLIPFAGYGISRQSLHLFDRSGNFPELNSTYNPVWKGPFLKLRSSINIVKNLNFTADVTYSQVNYNSTANWNLIRTFMHPVSYRHHANGYGIDAAGNLVYTIYRNLQIHVGAGYYSWQTGNGTDELYLNNGQVNQTQLNEAVRTGFRVQGGVGLAF
jgi:hypothetical protein